MTDRILLIDLPPGINARIVGVLGGINFRKRLESLGLRPGSIIRKINTQFGRGPITVQVGRTQVALGYGMAGKIEVEVVDA